MELWFPNGSRCVIHNSVVGQKEIHSNLFSRQRLNDGFYRQRWNGGFYRQRWNDGFHRQWWNGECYNGTEEENEEESEWYVHGWVKMVGVC
jgi:hypothetical protein